MREIKFRGYSKIELITPTQWITDGYGVTTIEYTDDTESTHLITPYGDYLVDKESVGQYTGLKDIKGKEIYEGDIIKTKDFYECGELVFKGKLTVIKSMFDYINKCIFIDTDGEIIGNIYENKDLLEG